MSKLNLNTDKNKYMDSAGIAGKIVRFLKSPSVKFTVREGNLRILSSGLILFAVIGLGSSEAHAGFNTKRIEARLAYSGHTHVKWVSARYPYVVDACLRGIRFRMTFNKKRRMKGRTKLGHCRHDRLKYNSHPLTERELVPSLKGDDLKERVVGGGYIQKDFVSNEVHKGENFGNDRIEPLADNYGTSGIRYSRPADEYDEVLEYQHEGNKHHTIKRFPRYAVTPLPQILETLRDQGFYNIRVRRKFFGVHSIGACYGKRRYHLKVNGLGEIIREKYQGRCHGYREYTNSFRFQF